MQDPAGAWAPALQRIQRNTRIHSHASGAVLGTLVLPGAKLHTRHQGAVSVTEHSRDGFAVWAEIISTLISEGWNCIRALMFQSPGRKGRWAAAGCECWWHCRAVPSCMCQPGSQVCCDTHVGVMDLRHQGEPFLSKDLLPLSLTDTGRYSQSIWEMVAQSWGDWPCLRVIYLILCHVPFSGCILVLEPRGICH